MSASSSVNITELIDRYPLGPSQIKIIVLCGLVALLDGFDLLAIGVAAPAMAGPLHIAPRQFGFIFSAALFGLMLGAFGLGRSQIATGVGVEEIKGGQSTNLPPRCFKWVIGKEEGL